MVSVPIQYNFHEVESVYYYNSLESGIIEYNPACLQIPNFEIQNTYLLEGLDFDRINTYNIPILCCDNNIWKIDLTLYENFKL